MGRWRRLGLAMAGLVAVTARAEAQGSVTIDGRGVTWAAPDGVTRISMRFRMQQMFTLRTASDDDLDITQAYFQVRRARLRFGGPVWDPRLSFVLQLAFARADLDYADTQFPNILRDATISWRFTPNFSMTAGQGKLPGNREQLISSADLEFPERSIVTSRFTLDRDVGVQAALADTVGGMPLLLRAAVSGGEGRNPTGNDDGLAYSGRLEWQPLGPFAESGDDVEGDLVRQTHPHLALAVSGQHNVRTARAGGQLGPVLYAPRTINTLEADASFKYRGLSIYGEWARRDADDPITRQTGSADRYVYAGHGALVQVSYLVGNKWAPALRWARTTPDAAIVDEPGAAEEEQLVAGLTRYFRRHRVKSTVELTHDAIAANAVAPRKTSWIMRWALELGI